MPLPALLLAGCAEVARVAVYLPALEEPSQGKLPLTVLALGDPCVACPDQRREENLRSSLVRWLSETGRFRVLEGCRPECEGWSSEAARELGCRYGADLILFYRLSRFDLRRTRHHVHEYYDASATGRAALMDGVSGQVLRDFQERVYLSTREKYSSRAEAEDLALERLGEKLARQLLYRDTGRLVELADPADGSQREGIELAKRGEWGKAVDAWKKLLNVTPAEAAARYNIGVAEALVGRKGAVDGRNSKSPAD